MPKYYTYKKQQVEFCATLLTVQLLDHENTEKEAYENSFTNLIQHMKWTPDFSKKVIGFALSKKMIINQNNHFYLTDFGRENAKQSFTIT